MSFKIHFTPKYEYELWGYYYILPVIVSMIFEKDFRNLRLPSNFKRILFYHKNAISKNTWEKPSYMP